VQFRPWRALVSALAFALIWQGWTPAPAAAINPTVSGTVTTSASAPLPGASADAYRDAQRSLMSAGRMDDAIMMDIDDVTAKFGHKYDDAILEMIEALPPSSGGP